MKSRMKIALTVLLALIPLVTVQGCAQRKTVVKDSASTPATSAAIKSIKIADDGGSIEVVLDHPVAYTFYKISDPLKAVVDLAQVDTSSVAQTAAINKGNLLKYDLVKQGFGSGYLTRLEIYLQKDGDFTVSTDATDKAKLSITFTAKNFEDKPATSSVPKEPVAEVTQSPVKDPVLAAEKKQPEEVKAPKAEAKSPEAEVKAPVAEVKAPAAEIKAPEPDVKVAAAEVKTPEVEAKVPLAEVKALEVEKPAAVSHQAPITEPVAKNIASNDLSLNAINVVKDGVEILLSGDVTNFNAFKLTKPERLVVDLFGVRNLLARNVVQINEFGINQARIGATKEKLRIVLDASVGEIPQYHVDKSATGIKLTIEPPVQKMIEPAREKVAATEPAPAPVPMPVPVTTAPPVETTRSNTDLQKLAAVSEAASKNEIEAIDFKLVDGYSQIAIRAGSHCKVGKPVKTAEGLQLSIANCQLPKNQQRFIDTSSFASVVKGITPFPVKGRKGASARILLKLRAEAPYRIKQDGNITYWEIKNTELPPESEKTAINKPKAVAHDIAKVEEKELGEAVLAKGSTETGHSEFKKNYSGRRVTLEFSDADIRKIFQLIAEVSNLNFLIGDDVTGMISIKLVNVPWDQALDVILESKQLAMKRDGNIVQIRPKGKMLTIEEEESAAKITRENAMDLKTIIFEVNYAKIDDVSAQFSVIKSKRGSISKDSRTNRIIVKDIEPVIEDMKFLMKNLDLPEKQVMIEARIVEASSTFTRDLGVKWTVGYQDGSASFANINSLDSSFGGIVSSVLPTTTAGGMVTGMSFGKLTSNIQLDMRLSAAASIGQVKVISTPKVLTLNNKKAKISQGQSVPYQTVSAEGTKTEFIEAVLTLEVTPHITADGNVGMEVKASNNSVGTGGSPPPINKKEATTELVVKNGETTVIGGIYIDSDTETETGVPFLMDIPLMGWMFKSNSKSKNKTELLIFITPKIIN